MSQLGDAQADIEAAAVTVAGVRKYALGESITPPAVVVGPAAWDAETACVGPTSATYPVWVITDLSDRSLEQLYELGPQVAIAIEENTPAVVPRAVPGTYSSAGSGDLPCYELDVIYPL